MPHFLLNDRMTHVAGPPGRPALDYLRHEAGLTGVKHACREGDCGSCAVLLGRLRGGQMHYQVVTSCLLPCGCLHGRHVVTIEGLRTASASPIERAFADHAASQCGFCTPGFVISLAGYLLDAPDWSTGGCVEAVAGNICRCTGYTSIRRALGDLVEGLRRRLDPAEPRVAALVRDGSLPEFFLDVSDRLAEVPPTEVADLPHPHQLPVAGGTDLYVQRPEAVEEAEIFLICEPEEPVRIEGDYLYLAAGATAEDLKRSSVLAEEVGGIERAMALMGSWPIRNRATVAGNLVNASPIGDMTIVLLALDAELELAGPDGSRGVPLERFFLHYKVLDLRPGELVRRVRFRRPGRDARFNFEKVSKRTHLDIATVNSAMSIVTRGDRIAEVRVSAGGVGPTPMRLPKTESVLAGRPLDAATARTAAAVARSEISPITDVRGSAAYKALLLQHLVLGHFQALFGIEDGLVEEASA